MNPIYSVDGASIPTPCAYEYSLNDVSSSDAGRTEDAIMHKNRIAQKVTIHLEWWGVDTSTAHQILTAFNPEYITVRYLDPANGANSGNYYVTKNFYVGDRSAPLFNATLDVWSNISFNIIER